MLQQCFKNPLIRIAGQRQLASGILFLPQPEAPEANFHISGSSALMLHVRGHGLE
jgi:hypothetical protein